MKARASSADRHSKDFLIWHYHADVWMSVQNLVQWKCNKMCACVCVSTCVVCVHVCVRMHAHMLTCVPACAVCVCLWCACVCVCYCVRYCVSDVDVVVRVLNHWGNRWGISNSLVKAVKLSDLFSMTKGSAVEWRWAVNHRLFSVVTKWHNILKKCSEGVDALDRGDLEAWRVVGRQVIPCQKTLSDTTSEVVKWYTTSKDIKWCHLKRRQVAPCWKMSSDTMSKDVKWHHVKKHHINLCCVVYSPCPSGWSFLAKSEVN